MKKSSIAASVLASLAAAAIAAYVALHGHDPLSLPFLGTDEEILVAAAGLDPGANTCVTCEVVLPVIVDDAGNEKLAHRSVKFCGKKGVDSQDWKARCWTRAEAWCGVKLPAGLDAAQVEKPKEPGLDADVKEGELPKEGEEPPKEEPPIEPGPVEPPKEEPKDPPDAASEAEARSAAEKNCLELAFLACLEHVNSVLSSPSRVILETCTKSSFDPGVQIDGGGKVPSPVKVSADIKNDGVGCACAGSKPCDALDDLGHWVVPAPKARVFRPGRWRGDCVPCNCVETWLRTEPGSTILDECKR